MGDPISALAAVGLAENVLSFVSLAFKISRQAYNSADGISKDLEDTGVVTRQLRESSEKLSAGLSDFDKDSGNSDDLELVSMARSCERLAGDLIKKINDHKLEPGPFRRVRSVKQALRAAWNKSDIEKLDKHLQKYKKELDSRIIISLR